MDELCGRRGSCCSLDYTMLMAGLTGTDVNMALMSYETMTSHGRSWTNLMWLINCLVF